MTSVLSSAAINPTMNSGKGNKTSAELARSLLDSMKIRVEGNTDSTSLPSIKKQISGTAKPPIARSASQVLPTNTNSPTDTKLRSASRGATPASSIPNTDSNKPNMEKSQKPNSNPKPVPPPVGALSKPPSSTTLPSIKKSTNEESGPSAQVIQAYLKSQKNITPKVTPSQAKPATSPKGTPTTKNRFATKPTGAIAAVARKVAAKTTAPAVMKQPASLSRTPSSTSPATKPVTSKPNTKNGGRTQGTKKTMASIPTIGKSKVSPAKRPAPARQNENDDYDYEDDFIDNSDTYKSPLNLTGYLQQLGFSRGPTSMRTYRGLGTNGPEDMMDMDDDDDDDDYNMEVNSFTDHIAMDARTTKTAIEEDKREREEEKKQKAKEKRSSLPPTANKKKKI